MKIWFISLLVILSCTACASNKPNPVANEQLILIVPEPLLQQPEPLKQL